MEKVRKLFISIPMHGRSDDEVWMEMSIYHKRLQTLYDEILDLVDNLHKDRPMNRVEMLGDSIQLMGGSDIILFAPGWADSKGCSVEHEIAIKYMKDKILSDDDRKKIVYGGEV